MLALVVVWQLWHANRIFTGVSVAGVPVGGLTRAAAVDTLNRAGATYAPPPISLYTADRQWPVPAAQISAILDVPDAVNRAYLMGREGPLAARIGQQLGLALRGYDIPPQTQFELAALRATVSEIAASVRQPGRAALQVGAVAVPAQPGVDVDEAATVAAVVTALHEAGAAAHLRVPVATIALAPPAQLVPLPVADLSAGALPPAMLLRDARSDLELALDPEVLKSAVYTQVPLRIDRDVLRDYLTRLAQEVEVPVRDARLRFNPATGGITVIRSSRSGRGLDIDATMAALERALASGADRGRTGHVHGGARGRYEPRRRDGHS